MNDLEEINFRKNTRFCLKTNRISKKNMRIQSLEICIVISKFQDYRDSEFSEVFVVSIKKK